MPFNDHKERLKIQEEVERASNYYYHSAQQQGIDNKTKMFLIKEIIPYIKGSSVLELGYIDGLWTDKLLSLGFSVDIVEGALKHVEHAQNKYENQPKVRIFQQLFQEFQPQTKYQTILAGDVLTYIMNPVTFLNSLQSYLVPSGKLIVTVPNSRSFHRRLGALMNLESTPTSANQRDQEVGNIRSYDRYELRSLLIESGFNIQDLHGCFFKPLSSKQMENWDDRLLSALYEIGHELEDYCWFLYAICNVESTN